MSNSRNLAWTVGISALASAVLLFVGGPAQAATGAPVGEQQSTAVCPASLMCDAAISACR